MQSMDWGTDGVTASLSYCNAIASTFMGTFCVITAVLEVLDHNDGRQTVQLLQLLHPFFQNQAHSILVWQTAVM